MLNLHTHQRCGIGGQRNFKNIAVIHAAVGRLVFTDKMLFWGLRGTEILVADALIMQEFPVYLHGIIFCINIYINGASARMGKSWKKKVKNND